MTVFRRFTITACTIWMLATAGNALAITPFDAFAYRQSLRELLLETQQLHALSQDTDKPFVADEQRIDAILDLLSDEDLQRLSNGNASLTRMNFALAELRASNRWLEDLQNYAITTHSNDDALILEPSGPQTNTIEFPQPEPLSACNNTSPAEAFSLMIAVSALEEVLASAKWLCEVLEAGENGALACAAIGITTRELQGSFEFAEFCLADIRRADGEAMLETQRNIGMHLNQFVDATTSSRATQDSVDSLQADITSANMQLTAIQSDVDTQFTTVRERLTTALSDLQVLTQRENGLIAQAIDLQFRSQVAQVDLQDIQERAADLQQDALEIRTATQQLIARVNNINNQLVTYQSAFDQQQTQSHRDTIAKVLSNPDLTIIRYVLPLSQGGALEEVREVLVQAIITLDGFGVKTNTARGLLTQGDQAYAQQNYQAAYSFFAAAYQSLNAIALPPAPIKPRS